MNIRLFAESFQKFDKRFFTIVLLEGAFFLIISFILLGFILLLKIVLIPLHDSVPLLKEAEEAKASQDIERLMKMQKDLGFYPVMMQKFFIRMAALIITLTILIFMVIGYFQGKILSLLANKKFDKLFFKKFLYLNIIWHFFWLLMYIISFILVNASLRIFVAAFWLAVYSYFTVLIYLKFNKSKGIFISIKESIKFGIKKIHNLIPSYLLSFALLILLVFALNMFFLRIPTSAFLIIAYLILIIFTSWFFLYLSKVMTYVKE